MKEILLSFILPLKMKRFRFMSVFIAMLIFIASVYCIALPNQLYIKSHKDEYLSQKSYVNAYIDLPEETNGDFKRLKDAQYKMNDKFEMTSPIAHDGFAIYSFESIDIQLFDEDPKVSNFYIVFDINNTLSQRLEKIKEDYTNMYPDDSKEKIQNASYLYYLDTLNENIEINKEYQNKRFLELHNEEETKLKELKNKITNFDLFGLDVSENSYLLIFMKSTLSTQIPYYDKSEDKITYPSLTTYYKTSDMNFDFTQITSLRDFGNQYVDLMFKPLEQTDRTNYLLQVIGYVILFPAIYVLVLCWTMKKRGVMKTFKEYYNIASISSVLPLLITFILGWFIPNVVIVYGFLFCIFTLFVFIKINSTPELAD